MKEIQRVPAQFMLVVLAASAGIYARTALGPLQEAVRNSLALSDNEVALLQGIALTLPVMIAVIPLGLLVDRYSRVRLLFIFTALNLIGGVLTAMASSFTLLFAARCLVGLAAMATGTAAYSLIADLFEEERRGRATMVYAVGQYAGMSAAFALGGRLLATMGGGAGDWRTAMMYLVSPLALIALSILALREPTRRESIIQNPSLRDIGVEIWRYRTVMGPLLLAVILAEVSVGAALTWAAPALARSFNLPSHRVGVIMATGLLVSGIAGPVIGGVLADFCQRTGGPQRTLSFLCGLSLLLVPTAMFAFVPQESTASVLLVAFLAVGSAIGVMGTTLFAIVIPNELRGFTIATLFGVCLFFSVGLGPMAVSVLANAMGGPMMIGKALAIAGAAASVLAAATFAFGKRNVGV